MYKYPYGDSQQLNLDWILAKLKELEASGGSGGVDLEEVSNALIALTYNNSTIYQRYDYAFRNDKLYRCLSTTSGTFDPAAWQEALIGDDLAVLTRWINAIDAAAVVDVKFDTSGTNGKIQQKYHDQYHDVVEVDYTPVQNSKRPLSSNAGYELNGAINNFRPNQLKRKWIFIGDSYGHASGSNQGWIDKLVPMLGLSSSDYYQSAVGGYGFASQTLSFLSLLTTLSASITDKTAITDIVVLGGANDIAVTAESISSGIEAFNTYAYTNYPNAIVRIGMIAGCADQTKVGTQYSRTKEGYSNCGKAQYLNNLEFVFQNRDYIGSDNIHPTATGYEVLTKKIYEALNGGCNVIYRDFGQIVPPTGFALTTTESFYNVIVNNGITNITIANRPGVVTTDSTKYFNVQAQNAMIPIGTLPTKLILSESIGQYNVLTSAAMQVKIRSTVNNQYYLLSGFCFISGRTIYFRPVDPATGGSSAYTSCDLIEASAISFSAASIMC